MRILRPSLCLVVGASMAVAQTGESWKGNHDESQVRAYSLPDPLTFVNGGKVKSAAEWKSKRRAELLSLFETNVYGQTPKGQVKPRFQVDSIDQKALGGRAVRKLVTIGFAGEGSPKIHVLLYTPAGRKERVPVFLGLNFGGNHTVGLDEGVPLGQVWTKTGDGPSREKAAHTLKAALPETRGSAASRWPVERILERGYGIATAYYGDIEGDWDGAWRYGVRKIMLRPGQTEPGASDWGAIGAWAWGLSRIADYLTTDENVDPERIAVIGHSRIGKATLWAAAQDERFAMVISNNSGEGGAALAKRNFGEDVWRINNNFPHWFGPAFKAFGKREAELPVDQHMLLALIAPRPLYVASASEDLHADPRGEFLSLVHAGPVYELVGRRSLGTDEMPGIERPIHKDVGYHLRGGKHDITQYDWDQYCNFADLQWGREDRPGGLSHRK